MSTSFHVAHLKPLQRMSEHPFEHIVGTFGIAPQTIASSISWSSPSCPHIDKASILTVMESRASGNAWSHVYLPICAEG